MPPPLADEATLARRLRDLCDEHGVAGGAAAASSAASELLAAVDATFQTVMATQAEEEAAEAEGPTAAELAAAEAEEAAARAADVRADAEGEVAAAAEWVRLATEELAALEETAATCELVAGSRAVYDSIDGQINVTVVSVLRDSNGVVYTLLLPDGTNARVDKRNVLRAVRVEETAEATASLERARAAHDATTAALAALPAADDAAPPPADAAAPPPRVRRGSAWAEWERQEGVRSDEGLQREAWVRAQKGVREDDALRLCLSLAIDGDAAAAATTLDALASAERDAWVARRGGAPAVAELAALGRLQLLGLRRRRLELLAHLNWVIAVRRRIATEEEVLQARSRGERAWEDGVPVPTEHEATLAARLEEHGLPRDLCGTPPPAPRLKPRGTEEPPDYAADARLLARMRDTISGAPATRFPLPLAPGGTLPAPSVHTSLGGAVVYDAALGSLHEVQEELVVRGSSLLRLMTLCEYHERRHEAAIAADRGKVKLYADSDSDDDGAAAEAEAPVDTEEELAGMVAAAEVVGAKVDRAALLTALLDREIEFARARRRLVSALLLLHPHCSTPPQRVALTQRIVDDMRPPPARRRRRRRRRSTPPPPPPSPVATSRRSPPSPRAAPSTLRANGSSARRRRRRRRRSRARPSSSSASSPTPPRAGSKTTAGPARRRPQSSPFPRRLTCCARGWARSRRRPTASPPPPSAPPPSITPSSC